MKRRSPPLFAVLLVIVSLLACRLLPAEPGANPELASAQTQLAAQARTRLAELAGTPTLTAVDRGTPAEVTATPSVTDASAGVTPAASATAQPGGGGTGILTPTPTRTVPASQTRTPTVTQTVQPGWAGDWTACMEQDDGTQFCGPLSITLDGTALSATGTLGGLQYTFTGKTSAEGNIAFGSWNNPNRNGWFEWTLLPDGQFAGSRDAQFGFCGTRRGSEMPEPCRLPPLARHSMEI